MDRTQPPRSRTTTWEDPAPLADALGTSSGLDFLRAIASGALPYPPALALLGIEAVEAEEGRVVFSLAPQEAHENPLGGVHGGVLSALLDTAAGCAVHSTLPTGTGYTSLDLSVRFVRAVRAGSGPLRCEGTVLARGSRTAVAEARATDPRGRLVAQATSTCLLLPLGGRGD